MSILSIDTSLKNTSINIISGNDSTNKILLSDKPNHFEVLLPLLNDAIKELEINLFEIPKLFIKDFFVINESLYIYEEDFYNRFLIKKK